MQESVRQDLDTLWGLWPTVGLGLAIAVIFFVVQVVTAVVYLFMQSASGAVTPELLDRLTTDGTFIAVATILTAGICTPLVFLFAHLKRGSRVSAYLGFNFPDIKVFIKWLLLIAVMAAVFDGLMVLFDKPRIPNFIIESYGSVGFLPLFWFAIVVAAPFFEEVLFRGFIYAGLANSRLGVWGAIVVTSLAWSVIHLQYDAFLIMLIFIAGLVLGYARYKTRSLTICIAMHMLFNLIALIEVAVFLQPAGA